MLLIWISLSTDFFLDVKSSLTDLCRSGLILCCLESEFSLMWRCVLHCFFVFLLGKRSGRSKKWREMLKLPPVSQCESIRCSIGRYPPEQSVWSLRRKRVSLVVLNERLLPCSERRAFRPLTWWRIYGEVNLQEDRSCITAPCLLKETASERWIYKAMN